MAASRQSDRKPPAPPVIVIVVLLFLFPSLLYGQETDSLRHYDLDEIVVESGEAQTPSATIQRISLNEIARLNAPTVGRVLRLVPGAHVQTNSRGETLVYLRNAGERQVAVFLAGALLNVPWDNRVDLASVPAGVVGSVEVAKGPTSVLYGTNVVGGAVNLIPRSLDRPGRFSEVGFSLGTEASRDAHAVHLGRTGAWRYGFSVDHSQRDGVPVPEAADVPFSQEPDAARTNTDRRFTGLYASASRRLGSSSQIGLTLLHNEGRKGVAPESHLVPSEGVRFWRYPKIKRTYGIVNAAAPIGPGRMTAVGWAAGFGQDIDRFTDDSYGQREASQADRDLALGTRLSYDLPLTSQTDVLVAANYLYSQHDQRNEAPDSTRVALMPISDVNYRQDIYSIGAEVRHRLDTSTLVRIGGSLDGFIAPDASAEARSSASAWTASAGLTKQLDDAWSLRISAGRKVRFPTTRELLDTGLGRFVLNPELGPESSVLAEVAIAMSTNRVGFEVIPFANYTSDTIDQIRVQLDGVSRRQRVNLEGSSVFGLEFVGTAKPQDRVDLDFSIAVMRARGREDGASIKLTEKPDAVASLGLGARLVGGLLLAAQTTYTGAAYGRLESGELTPLRRSTIVDLKLSWLVTMPGTGAIVEVYGRVDNTFDSVSLAQLGLPGAGRMLRFGVTLAK